MPETKTLLLIPLDDTVVFPTMDVTLPVDVGDAEEVLLVPRHEGEYAAVGTIARVAERVRLPGGGRGAALEGVARGVAGAASSDHAGRLVVETTPSPDETPVDGRTRELEREYRAIVEEILELRGDDGRIAGWVRSIVEPGALADTSGYAPDLRFEQKVQILETLDVTERLELALGFQRERLAELQVRRRIRDDVEEGAAKQQREYVLRKQMESIRRELGEDDASVADEYRTKIAESGMPENVREQAEREVDRLERMGDGSGESSMIRNYLDWIVSVPWGERSEERLDPVHTREVLDEDHAGLERRQGPDRRVRRRAQAAPGARHRGRQGRALGASRAQAGAILTLIGPPGTGKTSIGESIARSMDREFVRMSLGGVRDEAEIRGHRRTYIGALPGRLVRALRDAGTMNPVILLDEVDKVGADWRGDPSSALLEVLDPAQNSTFRDHYLDVEIDLSDVIFIATANQAETIPGPLLDRMEVIRFDGYTVAEKVAIARDYLVPRQRERNGLREDEVSSATTLLRTIVTEYTREAGVRNLERELGTLLRKTATRIASGDARGARSSSTSTPCATRSAARRSSRRRPRARRCPAWRPAWPSPEPAATCCSSRRRRWRARAPARLTLTGQLGDVMKESARIALTYVRAHAEQLGIDAGRVRGPRVPRPRAGGRDPEGRPERRHHDDDGARVAAVRARRAPHRRHDRRGDAAGPRAADRRAQAEGARGARRRADRRDPAGAQPRRSRRRARGRARGDELPPGDDDRRGARAGARAGRRRRDGGAKS